MLCISALSPSRTLFKNLSRLEWQKQRLVEPASADPQWVVWVRMQWPKRAVGTKGFTVLSEMNWGQMHHNRTTRAALTKGFAACTSTMWESTYREEPSKVLQLKSHNKIFQPHKFPWHLPKSGEDLQWLRKKV